MNRQAAGKMARELAAAIERFNKLPVRAVSEESAARLRGRHGFVPVEQYGLAMALVAATGEIGAIAGVRYRRKTRAGER